MPAKPPPKGTHQRLQPGDSVEQAARKMVARHLGHLRTHEPGVRAGDDADAIHDMRVAVRRLRAAVRAFAPGAPVSERFLAAELRWLGRALGEVRDLDVQTELLRNYLSRRPAQTREVLAPFSAQLADERAARHVRLRAALDSPRYARLLQRLDRFARGDYRRSTERDAASEPIAELGGRAVKHALRRVEKRAEHAVAAPAPPAEDLHLLRIRAKRLRYLLEFLGDLLGKPGRRVVKRLVRLQDLLGAHHDAVVAVAFIRRHLERDTLGAAERSALARFASAQQRLANRARTGFHEAWKEFAASETSDDLSAALRRLSPTPTKDPS